MCSQCKNVGLLAHLITKMNKETIPVNTLGKLVARLVVSSMHLMMKDDCAPRRECCSKVHSRSQRERDINVNKHQSTFVWTFFFNKKINDVKIIEIMDIWSDARRFNYARRLDQSRWLQFSSEEAPRIGIKFWESQLQWDLEVLYLQDSQVCISPEWNWRYPLIDASRWSSGLEIINMWTLSQKKILKDDSEQYPRNYLTGSAYVEKTVRELTVSHFFLSTVPTFFSYEEMNHWLYQSSITK